MLVFELFDPHIENTNVIHKLNYEKPFVLLTFLVSEFETNL